MQETLPTFVLHREAINRTAMSDTPGTPNAEQSGAEGSDEQLMVAFSRGSTDAFSELFKRYKQPLFGFFRRRLTDPTEAEQLAQETFLAVLRASSRYQPRALFRTYLYAIGFRSWEHIGVKRLFGPRLSARSVGFARLPKRTASTQKSYCGKRWNNSSAWIAKFCCCVNSSS